jgi:hypothetical protein
MVSVKHTFGASIFVLVALSAFLSAPSLQSQSLQSPQSRSAGSSALRTDRPSQAWLRRAFARLPLAFETNRGQAGKSVEFVARTSAYTLFLTQHGALLAPQRANSRSLLDLLGSGSVSLRSRMQRPLVPSQAPSHRNSPAHSPEVLQMRLVGSDPSAEAVGLDPVPSKTNYFIGKDPQEWHTNIPSYARVEYKGVYPGVDLVYHGDRGKLEYDFFIAPGADADSIELKLTTDSPDRSHPANGEPPLRIAANGDLVIGKDGEEVRFRRPAVYQVAQMRTEKNTGRASHSKASSREHYVDCRFVLKGRDRVGFRVGAYDRSRPLVIDPAIVYSTYLDGTPGQEGRGSTANSVAAFTDPTTGHVYAYVAGATSQADFPTVNAIQPVFAGPTTDFYQGDAFVTKFDPSAFGTGSVIWSTYLGGSGHDVANAIAVDSAGNTYVTGQTDSTDYPIMNAYQPTAKGQDAFVAKINADGSALLYSSYFGGSGDDSANAVAVDSTGNAYIAGSTRSADLPTVNPFQATLPNNNVGAPFVAIFDPTSAGTASLLYSTYLGGSDGDKYAAGTAQAIAVDASGSVHVGGYTTSNSFPIVNGFQAVPTGTAPGGYLSGGSGGAFYARLNPAAAGSAQLRYSTYLGGFHDEVSAIAVDTSGNAYLTGFTGSGLFPTTPGAYDTLPQPPGLYGGYFGPFIAKINPSQASSSSLVYSTLLPASQTSDDSRAAGIAVDTNGDAFAAGTASPGIPLVNPAMDSANGVFQSVDRGVTWTKLTQGLAEFPISALAVDTSTSPRTLYAANYGGVHATDAGVFASADGGLNWTEVFHMPSPTAPNWCANNTLAPCIFALAVDPTTPSNVYVGTSAGVFKSSDRGSTWSAFNSGLSSTAVQNVGALFFDRGTLYAGTWDGLYELGPGATTWTPTAQKEDVGSIAVDPSTSPHALYTAAQDSGAYKSTDGGNTWQPIGPSYAHFTSIEVDASTVPAKLYAYDKDDDNYYQSEVYESTDGGNTWNVLPDTVLSGIDPAANIVVDTTTTPSTVYVRDVANGIFKTTDGGNSWTPVLAMPIGAMAVDTTTANGSTPSTLYAATSNPNSNAFVVELDPTGSTLLFSTYLGGVSLDTFANGLAVAPSGNIFLTGRVSAPIFLSGPYSFPTVNAFQSSIGAASPCNCGSSFGAAFFVEFGSQPLPTSGSVTAQTLVQTGTLSVKFSTITGSTTNTAPTLTVTPLSSTATANFSLSDNLGAYDISTTATYSGSVTLCFQALTVNDQTTFDNLQILHVVDGMPQNITTSYDFATRTICGTVTSFSPFILVKGIVNQLKDLVRAVDESDVRKGIATSLDAKLENAEDAFDSASTNDKTTVCNLMGAFIDNVQAQSGQSLTLAEAESFTSAARQIEATLSCTQ